MPLPHPQRLHDDRLLDIDRTCAIGPQWLHDRRRDAVRSIRIGIGLTP